MSYSGYGSYNRSFQLQGSTLKLSNSKDNPLDSVSSIYWNPYEKQMFFVSSWDGYVRAYNITGSYSPQIKETWRCFFDHPVISCTINQNGLIFAGLANGQILVSDLRQPNNRSVIGFHNSPICKLFWLEKYNLLLSFGFDSIMKFWAVQTNGVSLQKQYELPSKTYTADVDYPYLVIGSAQSRVALIDLQKLPNLLIPSQYLKVSIQVFSKFTSCRVFAHRKKIMLGCSDGRMSFLQFKDYSNISFQQPLVSKTNKKQSSSSVYGQVNSVDIGMYQNQVYAIIAGSQQIAFFNLNTKDKAKKITVKTTALRLSPDGKYLVYAQGNDWNCGIDDFQRNKTPKILGVKFSNQDLNQMVKKKSN